VLRLILLLSLLAALALAALLGLRIYGDMRSALAAPMPITESVEYTLPRGRTMRGLADDMATRGWIESPRFFAWYARKQAKADRIKAGTFALTPGMSALDALDLFVSGKEIQHAFTVVEGWSFRELRAAIAARGEFVQTLGGVDDAEVMARLGEPGRHPEGMFHADTYLFSPGTSDQQILSRALRERQRRLEEIWGRRQPDLPLASAYEALILASIIEKETAVPEERPRIAGVFVSRLRKGMRLETDPTVIYGMGEAFDGNIRRRDLRADTPYNTYTRHGLPPTPIAMVGDAALRAAVNPVVDGSLFFVARGDGRHHFSPNYAQHRRAVRRYQIERRPPPPEKVGATR
jgi:UPF0755 protein